MQSTCGTALVPKEKPLNKAVKTGRRLVAKSVKIYPTYLPAVGANMQLASLYYQPATSTQDSDLGPVWYPDTTVSQSLQSTRIQRDPTDGLKAFRHDAKRCDIEPHNYYGVQRRLQTDALPLPTGNGYSSGYNRSNGRHNNTHLANLPQLSHRSTHSWW